MKKQELKNKLTEAIIKGDKSINWMPENIKTCHEIRAWVNTLPFTALRLHANNLK